VKEKMNNFDRIWIIFGIISLGLTIEGWNFFYAGIIMTIFFLISFGISLNSYFDEKVS